MKDEELEFYRHKMAETIGPYAYRMGDAVTEEFKKLYELYVAGPAHQAPMPEPKQDDWYYELY